MDQTDDIPLSKNTKILFNLIEIRLFDLSQVLQVGGHKLSINQIKEALQKQYNIFGQVEKIFEELKISKLYDLIKQISQNYVSIASILIDQKTFNNNQGKNKLQNEKKQEQKQLQKSEKTEKIKFSPHQAVKKKSMIKVQQHVTLQNINTTLQNLKGQQFELNHKLGGIHLFNENYKRGIETLQQKHQAWQQKKRKKYGQKQLILELISKEISDQADVQKLHDNDEISKFIREGKVKHELYTHIEYQKDLEGISSFLKQSQDDAMKFLMDTKKNKQEIDTKDNEDEIVVNYHELIQMLVEKKKTQYKTVQSKIKQIVDTFRFKLENMDYELKLKETNIRELQYKLKRKQGQQVGSQTVGLKSRNVKNSPDAIQQIEEQHKTVVQLLKKNLEENQREILTLGTDVKINQERLKKKEQQVIDLNEQIQKLKKQLKLQKQIFANQKISDSNLNTPPSDKVQNFIDTINQQPKIEENEQRQNSQERKSSHKRKKPKHSFFGNNNNILSAVKFVKPTEQDSLPMQNKMQTHKQITNNKTFKTSSSDNKKKSFKSSISDEREPEQQSQTQQKSFYSKNQTDEIQQSQDKSSRKGSQYQRNIVSNSSKNSTKQQNAAEAKKGVNNKGKAQLKNIEQNKIIYEKTNQMNTVQTLQSKSNSYQVSSNSNLLFIKSPQNLTTNLSNKQKSKQKIYVMQNQNQNIDEQITQYRQNQLQDKFKEDPFQNNNQLLSNNSLKIYELLFQSISKNDKYTDSQSQIKQLEKLLIKYDQNQLFYRLKIIFNLLNSSNQYNTNKPITEREHFEQDDNVVNSHQHPSYSEEFKPSSINPSKLFELKQPYHKSEETPVFRNIKANTDIEKWEKQQITQLQKNKKIKDLTKHILTTNLLKKIHNQLRISGKGFNVTKKQFIQLCKNINLEETDRNSLKSSDSSDHQELNQNYVTIKSQKANVAKSSKNIPKEQAKKQHNIQKIQDNQTLKIKGTGMETFQHENQKKQKMNNFKAHQRKQSQSMKNLFKSQNLEDQTDAQNLVKIEKLQMQKKPTSNHSLNAIQSVNRNTIQELNTQEFKIEKKKHIELFFKVLKDQGAKIQSIKKLQQVIQTNKISLNDLIKITSLITTQKNQNLTKIFSNQCNQSSNNAQNKLMGCTSKSCCHHIKKYSSFLQKLSLNEQWLKKIKKQVFAMHILNIDGGQQHKNDFYKKNLSKQKSIVKININSNNSPSVIKSIQTQSFYSSSKKNEQILCNRQALKKTAFSTHFQLKQKKNNFQTKNKPKNVESVSFLPQLANKTTSQSIKN